MARGSAAEAQIPANGAQSVPYVDHRELVNGLFAHVGEVFVAEGVGAGGAGVEITGIPFEPGVILLSENTGPLLQLQFPTAGGKVDINMISGAAAGAAIAAAVQQPDGTWNIQLTTAQAPDGDTASLVCFGVRDVAGGL